MRFFSSTTQENEVCRPKSGINLYPGGMQMPGRTFSPTESRYGYQGQEKTDEISGSGNHYQFKYREYDPRTENFWSVDPLAKLYPGWSPYAIAQRRIIDGIDFEGLEYVSAANWAEQNLTGWDFGSRGWYYSFNKYKQSSTVIQMKNEVYCYESALVSYAQGNGLVAEYLSSQNIPLNRADAINWFKKGGDYHSFINPDDAQNVSRGDILFKGAFTDMAGHAAIAAGAPVFSEDKNSFTIDVLSTNTGDENKYGTKTYTFTKDESGKWFDQDSGQELSGFGRVDESRLMEDSKMQKMEPIKIDQIPTNKEE